MPNDVGDRPGERERRAFDHLLKRLDPNRDKAGRRYEALRLKLIHFFSWHGLVEADHLADDTLNRLADKLLLGEEVLKLDAYLFAIARLVLLETFRREERRRKMVEQLTSVQEPVLPGEEDDQRLRRCLATCLGQLPLETRRLIIDYYRGTARQRINRRRELARELGVSANALRNRALRLRVKLEKCVARCRKRGPQKSETSARL